ncbi:MAG: sporulation protein YabP [Clostridia bacterium]
MADQRLIEAQARIRSHSVHIDNKELMSITGVKDVDSFNEQEVLLLTEVGELHIEGDGLHITKLNLDEGQVMLEGEITAMEYTEAEERGSLFRRLFR